MFLSHLSPLRSHPDKLLKDHLSNVAETSSSLFKTMKTLRLTLPGIDNSVLNNLIRIIGSSHDVGKATSYFQEYVRNNKAKIPYPQLKSHSSLSALYGFYATKQLISETEFRQAPFWAMLIIQGHHSSLNKPTELISRIFAWSKNLRDKQIRAIEDAQELDEILLSLKLPKFTEFISDISQLEREVLCSNIKEFMPQTVPRFSTFFSINNMYSILIDADRMDAADLGFPERKKIDGKLVEGYTSFLASKSKSKGGRSETIVKERGRLFSLLSEKAKTMPLNKHLLSLTAPTGSGKTLAGLNFALILRERLSSSLNIPRIIYIAPYLSILDQNASVFQKALKLNKVQSDLLLVHHHLADMNYGSIDQDQETYSGLDSELLIEGWNSEIIVTTFIQFFYSIIGTKTSQLRKFHNLEGSIIILDEIQSIPHTFWPLIHDALKFLADEFNAYVILMTATQPLIFDKDEITELVDGLDANVWRSRVTFEKNMQESIDLNKFESELDQRIKTEEAKSILVLMNTISSANEVFTHVKTERLKFFLSANVLPVERKRRIAKIDELLRKRKPLVLVSTQVIEAGVDLDFDLVIRDLGPIDSIVQAAGRCNRNGIKDPSESKVCVFRIVDEKGNEFGRRIYKDYLIEKTLETLEFSSNFETMVEDYYQRVRKGMSDTESNTLLKAMDDLNYNYIRDKFKLIDEEPRYSVYVKLDKRAEELWEKFAKIMSSKSSGLERKEAFIKIRSDFYEYVVNVRGEDIAGLDDHFGFYYVPHLILDRFYDYNLGFKRKNSGKSEINGENII